jgi:hypothetical protein
VCVESGCSLTVPTVTVVVGDLVSEYLLHCFVESTETTNSKEEAEDIDEDLENANGEEEVEEVDVEESESLRVSGLDVIEQDKDVLFVSIVDLIAEQCVRAFSALRFLDTKAISSVVHLCN